MAKKPEISLPVSVLLDYPGLAFTSGAAYRAALAIGLAYWRAGCPDRQLDSASLAALARMNAGQWSTVRVQVCEALPGLFAKLASTYAARAAMRASMATVQHRGAATLHAKRNRRDEKPAAAMTEKKQPAALQHATPHHAAPHSNPRTALQPAQLATIGAKTNAEKSAGKIIASLRDE